MNTNELEAHVAALSAFVANHAEPVLPDSEYENLVEQFADRIIPDDILDSSAVVFELQTAIRHFSKQLILDTLEQRDAELADGGVIDYLEQRHEIANRAHADDPTPENLHELERVGRLLGSLTS